MSDPTENSNTPTRSLTRHWSKRWWFRLAIIFLIIATYSGWQIWDINQFGHQDDGSSADCAIVLGAAAWHKKPSPVFKERINHAILLLKEKRIKAIILTGGFGENAKFAESEVARKYCIEQGILPKQIHIETNSKTTEQNITEAKKIMQQQGFKNALIVSDPWHLKRACNIAKHYKVDAKPSATKTSLNTSDKTQSTFLWKEFLKIHLWRIN